jgi:hypothetical protein
MDDAEARRELEATLAARKELGPEYDSHLAESFLEKIKNGLEKPGGGTQTVIHIKTPALLGSIGLGIPITAIALSDAPGAGGVIVAIAAWGAIALANIAFWRS